jgi:uncharacterized protein (TIGR04255 family)
MRDQPSELIYPAADNEGANSMPEWTYEGPNPIVGYAVGFQLRQPLVSEVLRKVSALHGRFRRELPRRVEQQALTFQVGGGPQSQPSVEMGGVTFDYLKPDGSTRAALIVLQRSVSYMVSDYSRWLEFWPVAERMLTEVGRAALPETAVEGLTLVANNRFEWSGRSDDGRLATLLRAQPSYVADHILDCAGACHSNHGYFATNEDPPGQRLDNINLAVFIQANSKLLHLDFDIRLTLTEPVADMGMLFDGSSGPSFLARSLDSLHNLNKCLMSKVLLESVAESIPGLVPAC